MFKKIFEPVCVGCGGACDYNSMLCESCVESLPRPEHGCMGCGRALAVDAYYCKHCDDRAEGVDFYYADFLYTGTLRTMVYKIKYEWYFRGARQMGDLCRIDGELLDGYDIIIPVPYHFRRRLVRFVQPVDIIAKELAARTDTPVVKAVERSVHTDYQSRLRRKERLANIKGVFRLVVDVADKEILIADDIVTTGATVKEMAGLLRRGGAARVDVYSLMTGVPR